MLSSWVEVPGGDMVSDRRWSSKPLTQLGGLCSVRLMKQPLKTSVCLPRCGSILFPMSLLGWAWGSWLWRRDSLLKLTHITCRAMLCQYPNTWLALRACCGPISSVCWLAKTTRPQHHLKASTYPFSRVVIKASKSMKWCMHYTCVLKCLFGGLPVWARTPQLLYRAYRLNFPPQSCN